MRRKCNIQQTFFRGFRSMKNCVAQKKGFVKNLKIFALIKSLEIICSKTLERKVCNLKSVHIVEFCYFKNTKGI